MSYNIIFTIIIIFFIFTGGCGHSKKEIKLAKPSTPLIKLAPSHYPVFADDLDYKQLKTALLYSIKYLGIVKETRLYSFGKDKFTAKHIKKSLQDFLAFIEKEPDSDELQQFIKSNYFVYKSIGSKKNGQVLFTGYYEPSLMGSLIADDRFKYPIYGKPKDLVSINLSLFSKKFKNEKKLVARYTGDDTNTVVPYYDRKELKKTKHLEKMSEPIVWVDNPIDLFFLEIQGSGKVFLQSGEILNIHYHTKNGRAYRSIGKYLIDNNKINKSDISMQSIRAYIKENPEQMNDIFNYNQSYVFFKVEENGPLGCLGFPVTQERSIATDRKIFPQSALAFIKTKKPIIDQFNNIIEWENFSRFVLNQDTGGAIVGPGRADIFWGNGQYAIITAGHLQHLGELYFLVQKR